MAKKKKVWKSSNSENLQFSQPEKIRSFLVDVVNGVHPLLRREKQLYQQLALMLDKIEDVENLETVLELLAWFLRTDFCVFKVDDDVVDDWSSLYYDAATFFLEVAAEFEDKEYLTDLVHDLLIRHVGGDGRSVVFINTADFLPPDNAHDLMQEIFDEVEEFDFENKDDILLGVCDIANAFEAITEYTKACLMRDPDKSNATLLDIANECYEMRNIELAKQWLDEVKNPAGEDEEDYLDLLAAIAFKEGRVSDNQKIARLLYEKFPTSINLSKLCTVVPKGEIESLILEHFNFRMNNHLDLSFLILLTTHKQYALFNRLLDGRESDLTIINATTLKVLVNEIEKDNQNELANRIRDWITPEPEELKPFVED